MCFLMDDEDHYDNAADVDPNNPSGSSKRSGAKRWQFHAHHTWVVPRKPLMLVLAMAIFFVVMGMLFMAIGGGVGIVGLSVVGGLMFGFGLVGVIICLLVCVYAFFYYGTKDQCTQTTDTPWADELTVETPGYASVGRPSALKSPDSTLKRNGTLGVKKVTMAPELGPYGEIQSSNALATSTPNNNNNNNSINTTNNPPLHRLPSTGSGTGSRSGSLARSGYVDGSTVGTGGIKIIPLDPNQPFPSPGSSVSYGGSAGQYYSTGGGGSTISSSTDTYAYPKQLSYDGSNNSGSQYSTLRSIPVTHLGPGSERQQHQKQGYREEVEYATVNKAAGKPGTTVVRVEHYPVPHSPAKSQGLLHHVHLGQESISSPKSVQGEDEGYKDYDNTVERIPMISQQQQNHMNSSSYHEKQMQFQRQHRGHQQQQQQQQDLRAPRQINAYSLQRQYAPNPFLVQKQQEQQDQQMQQYKMHYEQEKKQQQQQYQTQMSKSSNASSVRSSMVDDVFEPQPLVYPSARRPMTFEQVSSSKMSVYDNVLANNLQENDK